MSIISNIKANPKLKRFVLRLLIPANQHRPRLWVRLFLNPFRHKRGKGSVIRPRTRTDVFPFNNFNLGMKSIVEDFTTINNGVGHVIIGDRTIIGLGNTIIGPVEIGNDVMLAQNVVISGMNHGYEDISLPPSEQKDISRLIVIDDRCWIGANSVITIGVHIGKHSIIGAGSVVTKDVPAYSVAVGNPARVVKQYVPLSGLWEKVQ
jgi:acetyltransferase-like isoleucine patch superfamily enzyme